MTDPDDALLRSLAAADATHPPSPGAEFSPHGLRTTIARQRRRRVAAALALLGLATFAVLRPPNSSDAEAAADLASELSRQIESLQRVTSDWTARTHAAAAHEAAATRSARAAADLRIELAYARALPVLANPRLSPEQPR